MDKRIDRAIGGALRQLREQQGLTQSELAARFGANQSVVSKLESGERSLMFLDMYRYAYALGIPPERVFNVLKRSLAALGKQ